MHLASCTPWRVDPTWDRRKEEGHITGRVGRDWKAQTGRWPPYSPQPGPIRGMEETVVGTYEQGKGGHHQTGISRTEEGQEVFGP